MLRIPTMESTIRRRLLVNYRADPGVVKPLLPHPLRPRLVNGEAVVGICLIRLESIRPKGFPGRAGLSSENAAHRIAVEWQAPDGSLRTGVYIPARHTSSRPTVWFGGRLFPGVHSRARFDLQESGNDVSLELAATDGSCDVGVALTVVDEWPGSAIWPDLRAASDFFATGADGYSATHDQRRLDGLQLRTTQWRVEPAIVTRAASSYYDDLRIFPPGSVELDTALVMRGVPVSWHELPSMDVGPAAGTRSRVS